MLLGTVAGSALLVAMVCVVKRKSMYVLLGLIAGEIIGKFVYQLALERSGYGTNTLYVSIGFFAVVVRAPPTRQPVRLPVAPSLLLAPGSLLKPSGRVRCNRARTLSRRSATWRG